MVLKMVDGAKDLWIETVYDSNPDICDCGEYSVPIHVTTGFQLHVPVLSLI